MILFAVIPVLRTIVDPVIFVKPILVMVEFVADNEPVEILVIAKSVPVVNPVVNVIALPFNVVNTALVVVILVALRVPVDTLTVANNVPVVTVPKRSVDEVIFEATKLVKVALAEAIEAVLMDVEARSDGTVIFVSNTIDEPVAFVNTIFVLVIFVDCNEPVEILVVANNLPVVIPVDAITLPVVILLVTAKFVIVDEVARKVAVLTPVEANNVPVVKPTLSTMLEPVPVPMAIFAAVKLAT